MSYFQKLRLLPKAKVTSKSWGHWLKCTKNPKLYDISQHAASVNGRLQQQKIPKRIMLFVDCVNFSKKHSRMNRKNSPVTKTICCWPQPAVGGRPPHSGSSSDTCIKTTNQIWLTPNNITEDLQHCCPLATSQSHWESPCASARRVAIVPLPKGQKGKVLITSHP